MSQEIKIEVVREVKVGPAAVAVNIASAIQKICPSAKFKFVQDGKPVKGTPIPTDPFFREGEEFIVTVDSVEKSDA